MAGYRLSKSAKTDITAILKRSASLHGLLARTRYRALLTAALRHVAANPRGPLTTDRADLQTGFRSFHIRHSRNESAEAPVARPVHVIYFRKLRSGRVLILRVLHDRMSPRHHIDLRGGTPDPDQDEG
jgi:toxin ParE1/3/4